MNELVPKESGGEFLLYQTEDGRIRIETRMQEETVWLTQDQMAQLFVKAKSTINEHIKNIFKEVELVEEQVMRKFGNSEFSTKPTNYYNLDVIISVGYRVKSRAGPGQSPGGIREISPGTPERSFAGRRALPGCR